MRYGTVLTGKEKERKHKTKQGKKNSLKKCSLERFVCAMNVKHMVVSAAARQLLL